VEQGDPNQKVAVFVKGLNTIGVALSLNIPETVSPPKVIEMLVVTVLAVGLLTDKVHPLALPGFT
jgi:RNase H-fold protein (predicted Holliday junction resolvase)